MKTRRAKLWLWPRSKKTSLTHILLTRQKKLRYRNRHLVSKKTLLLCKASSSFISTLSSWICRCMFLSKLESTWNQASSTKKFTLQLKLPLIASSLACKILNIGGTWFTSGSTMLCSAFLAKRRAKTLLIYAWFNSITVISKSIRFTYLSSWSSATTRTQTRCSRTPTILILTCLFSLNDRLIN